MFEYSFDKDIRFREVFKSYLVLLTKLCFFSSTLLSFLHNPFAQRFEFHFFKSRKTNVDSKPEWFFNLLLSWIAGNMPFLEKLGRQLFDSEVLCSPISFVLSYFFASELAPLTAGKPLLWPAFFELIIQVVKWFFLVNSFRKLLWMHCGLFKKPF